MAFLLLLLLLGLVLAGYDAAELAKQVVGATRLLLLRSMLLVLVDSLVGELVEEIHDGFYGGLCVCRIWTCLVFGIHLNVRRIVEGMVLGYILENHG